MLIWMASIGLAALICFCIGAAWYSLLFGAALASLRSGNHPAIDGRPAAAVMLAEFGRCLIVAAAMAYLINRTGTVSWGDALTLAAVVWGGFQLFGLVGSVLHEGYPAKLYAIHMGDALVKALASAVIITGLTSHFG